MHMKRPVAAQHGALALPGRAVQTAPRGCLRSAAASLTHWPSSRALLHWLRALAPGECCLTALRLSFFICKMGK